MNTQTASNQKPINIPLSGKDKALLNINAYDDSEVTRVVDAAFEKAGIEPTKAPNGQPSRNGWWEWSSDMQSVIIHPYTN